MNYPKPLEYIVTYADKEMYQIALDNNYGIAEHIDPDDYYVDVEVATLKEAQEVANQLLLKCSDECVTIYRRDNIYNIYPNNPDQYPWRWKLNHVEQLCK